MDMGRRRGETKKHRSGGGGGGGGESPLDSGGGGGDPRSSLFLPEGRTADGRASPADFDARFRRPEAPGRPGPGPGGNVTGAAAPRSGSAARRSITFRAMRPPVSQVRFFGPCREEEEGGGGELRFEKPTHSSSLSLSRSGGVSAGV